MTLLQVSPSMCSMSVSSWSNCNRVVCSCKANPSRGSGVLRTTSCVYLSAQASPGSRKTAWRGRRDRKHPPDQARPQSQPYTAQHTGQPPLLAAKAEAETSDRFRAWATQGSNNPRRQKCCFQPCGLLLWQTARPSSFRLRTSPHRALSVLNR